MAVNALSTLFSENHVPTFKDEKCLPKGRILEPSIFDYQYLSQPILGQV